MSQYPKEVVVGTERVSHIDNLQQAKKHSILYRFDTDQEARGIQLFLTHNPFRQHTKLYLRCKSQ